MSFNTHTHKSISQCYRQVKKKIAKLLKWTVKAILEAEEQLLTRSRWFFFLHNLKSNISRHCIQFSSLPSSFNLHAGTKPYANDLQRPSTAVAWEQKFHRLWKKNWIETLELGKSFLSLFLPPRLTLTQLSWRAAIFRQGSTIQNLQDFEKKIFLCSLLTALFTDWKTNFITQRRVDGGQLHSNRLWRLIPHYWKKQAACDICTSSLSLPSCLLVRSYEGGQSGRILKMNQCFCLFLVGLGFTNNLALCAGTGDMKWSRKVRKLIRKPLSICSQQDLV